MSTLGRHLRVLPQPPVTTGNLIIRPPYDCAVALEWFERDDDLPGIEPCPVCSIRTRSVYTLHGVSLVQIAACSARHAQILLDNRPADDIKNILALLKFSRSPEPHAPLIDELLYDLDADELPPPPPVKRRRAARHYQHLRVIK